jgi:pilus assembly protein CpaF
VPQLGVPERRKSIATTEVMVNGPDDVYLEQKGWIERVADRLFEGEEAVLHVIERIVAALGLRVDATSPWVDARLPGRLSGADPIS